jgi:shikimate kinase
MGARTVFLVGFMGSGKNTVGQHLAQRLGWDFVDLDAQIERHEGHTIPEIFAAKGERGFRTAETAALQNLLRDSANRNRIVALGGGAFAEDLNQTLLRDYPTVFLDAPPEELWQRCQQDGVQRPLAKDFDQFCRLHARRLPSYRLATVTVETTGKKLPSICSEIEDALRLREAPDSLRTGESQ